MADEINQHSSNLGEDLNIKDCEEGAELLQLPKEVLDRDAELHGVRSRRKIEVEEE